MNINRMLEHAIDCCDKFFFGHFRVPWTAFLGIEEVLPKDVIQQSFRYASNGDRLYKDVESHGDKDFALGLLKFCYLLPPPPFPSPSRISAIHL